MSSPFLCVFGDDHVFFTWEQMMLQVMLLTLETKRGASLGCRARDFYYVLFYFCIGFFGNCNNFITTIS